jgi:hypothetical protein
MALTALKVFFAKIIQFSMEVKMKKLILVFFAIFLIAAVSFWFACNPFQQNGKKYSTGLNVLDESDEARLAISCAIDVNGSTWDGLGVTVQQASGNPLCDGSQCEGCCKPFFAVTNGTVLNCTMAPPTSEGIFLYGGNCTIDNVTAPDIGEDIVTVKKTGTFIVSNCTFNNGEDKVLQINDICTFTTQGVKADKASKFMRQNGAKTWKMTSYSNDCTIMNMSECIFRSDSSTSTFFYRNLTTNCATIGYPSGINGVVTKAVPY